MSSTPETPPPTDTWWARETLRARVRAGDLALGEGYLYRPGQLLLTDRAAGFVAGVLTAEHGGAVDESATWLTRIGLQRWQLDTDAELPALAAELDAIAHRQAADEGLEPAPDGLPDPVRVALNHVLTGQPKRWGGPSGDPTPAAAAKALDAAPMGATADIAVLDTGVPASDLLAQWHSALEGSVRRDPANADFPDDEDTLYATGAAGRLRHMAGHGTFICGLVHLVAPDLVISPYAVLDPDGMGDDAAIARGILAVGDAGVPVINLSLGGYTQGAAQPPAVEAAIAALPAGTVVVAAAGNFQTNQAFWPAAMPAVVAVAALDDIAGVLLPTPFTNVGAWVDVCTIGADLVSCYVDGDYPLGPQTAAPFDDPHPFARWSGTSFAAPLVAAELAARVKHGGVTGQRAWADLSATLAPFLGAPGLGQVYRPPVVPR